MDPYNHTAKGVSELTSVVHMVNQWHGTNLLLPEQFIENITHGGGWVLRFHTSFKSCDLHIQLAGLTLE